jgi:hypothetical protein
MHNALKDEHYPIGTVRVGDSSMIHDMIQDVIQDYESP